VSGPLDVVIAGADVVDGTGAPRRRADVGVRGGRIVAVDERTDSQAALMLDGRGLVLAPGFVDVHVHTDAAVLNDPVQEASIRQGVTTHVVGQDGFGYAPASPRTLAFMRWYLAGINGSTVPLAPGGIAEYLAQVDGRSAVNVAVLLPNGNLRMEVMGNGAGPADGEALGAMAALCRQAMQEGAVGLSSGLDYVPSMHASEEELTVLAAAAGELGGIYVTHVRYRAGLLDAVDEAIRIAAAARVPVHISHLYDSDPGSVLERIDRARGTGIQVGFDSYPYVFGSSLLAYLLPEWVFEGDERAIAGRLADRAVRDRVREWLPASHWDWSQWTVAGRPPQPFAWAVGLDLVEAAAGAGADPVDFACDLLLDAGMAVTVIGRPVCREAEILPFPRHPAHVLGSDGIHVPGRTHPRGHGAFARYVGRMVRDGVLTLEEAVRHATSMAADRFGLAHIGRVAQGEAADLVLFDPDALVDRATLEDSRAPAEGVRTVLVSGVPVLLDGEPSGATPGRALRRRTV
jgi:N-acyl-D-amino-acid deacylase